MIREDIDELYCVCRTHPFNDYRRYLERAPPFPIKSFYQDEEFEIVDPRAVNMITR